MNYLTVPLSAKLDRTGFQSGRDLLDRYFKYQANEDIEKKLAACYVYLGEDQKRVIGYYTLSASSIPQDMLTPDFTKRLPGSYSSIPMILLGRLAVDQRFQGKGIGRLLLVDALKRCYHSSELLGIFAVVVDPLDGNAMEFYLKFGFVLLPDSKKMVLPMRTIKGIFE
jgi:GNAT superfamily N-acetyltransferase